MCMPLAIGFLGVFHLVVLGPLPSPPLLRQKRKLENLDSLDVAGEHSLCVMFAG